MGLMAGGTSCRLGEGVMGWAGEIPMHHLTVSISVPSTARTYFRAFIARGSLPARVARRYDRVINDDNYYKEVNFLIVGVITSLWALSEPSSRIIAHSDFSYSRVFSWSVKRCETTRLLARMFFVVYWHILTELVLYARCEFDCKLWELFYCTLRNNISRS